MQAFPITPILETAGLPNEDPIETNWDGGANFLFNDSGRHQRVSNQMRDASGANGGTDTSTAYDAKQFGGDIEIYVQIPTISTVVADQVKLLAMNASDADANADGYELEYRVAAGTDTFRLRRRDNVTPTTLGADMTQEVSAGDWIGMEVMLDGTLNAWYKSATGGSSWVLLGTRTDTTYTGPWFIGLKTFQASAGAWRLQSFGGGTKSAVVRATDDFNRADNNSLGSNWTLVTPGWDATGFAIASNAAAPQALTGDDLEIYTGAAFPADHYAQAKVTVAGINAGTGIGVALRAGVDGSCYSIVVCKKSTGNIDIQRRLAGNSSFTSLSNPTSTWADGDTLTAKIVGNIITVYKNGVQIENPVTDSSGSALMTGAPGIVHSTTITSGSLDDFEAGDFSIPLLTGFSSFPSQRFGPF